MRQVGTLTNEADARRFADYLLTLEISARVDSAGDAFAIWVFDENQLERGKREFEEFREQPQDARYGNAAQVAKRLRRRQAGADRQRSKNFIDLGSRWHVPSSGRHPVTWVLLLLSVGLSLATGLGRPATEREQALLQDLYIAGSSQFEIAHHFSQLNHPPDESDAKQALRRMLTPEPAPFLAEVQRGQVWRLVTPIFLHFSVLHLMFDMLWLYRLGRLIEIRRGSWWFAGFVLLVTVVSNLAQYWWDGPYFGGMSGVDYGLFGFVWMKSRFEPAAGLYMPRDTTFIMLAWLVLCMTELMGPIGNAAHVAGLLVGVVVGYAPLLLKHWPAE